MLADQQSYFNQPPTLLSTNRAAKPPAPAASDPLGPLLPPFRGATNTISAKSGYIAELCVPGDSETARKILSALVNDLKQQALFLKVDLLSEDLRRSLADPKVLVADRHYALALDFATGEFQQPLREKKSFPSRSRPSPRRPGRSSVVPEANETSEVAR